MVRTNRGLTSPCRGSNRSIRETTGEAPGRRFRGFERSLCVFILLPYQQLRRTLIYGTKLHLGKPVIDTGRRARSGGGGRSERLTGVAGRTQPGKIFDLRHLACEPCCYGRPKTRRWCSSADIREY